MPNVIQLPFSLEAKARLLAAKLQPRKWTLRHKEIRIEAGRIAEQMRCNGAERWQCVQVEDAFAERVRSRLFELDEMNSGPRAPVISISKGAAA